MKNRPLRVLHILDTLGGGGSERLVWDIVRLSDPKRVKHRVVTFFPDGYVAPFVYADLLSEVGAYGNPGKRKRFAPVSNRSGLFGKMYVGFSAIYHVLLECFRFRPDIIHVHSYYLFTCGIVLKLVFRRPLVDTVPALFSQMSDQGTGWLVDQYRRYHRLVDCFLVASGYRSELLGIGVPAEKLLSLVGTVDLQAVDTIKSQSAQHRLEVRAKLGIPENSLIALSVGRLHSSKGHQYALEALPSLIKQFPNLHWVVLGEGSDRPELEARIKELGVDKHAHLIGFEPDPLPFYAAADIYLRTPVMESENISSFQAIAMELPAVGFDTHRETDLIARLGHGVLVPNMDAAALAMAVARVLSLPDRGRQMGRRGVDYCREQLDLRKHVERFTSMYTSLSQGKGTKLNRMEGLTMDV